TRHLANFRPVLEYDMNRCQIIALMQWSQRNQTVQIVQDVLVDQHTSAEFWAAVHNAVTYRHRGGGEAFLQPRGHDFLRTGEVSSLPGLQWAIHQTCAGVVLHFEGRTAATYAGNLATQQKLQSICGAQLVNLEFQAGTAGVDDQNHITHLCLPSTAPDADGPDDQRKTKRRHKRPTWCVGCLRGWSESPVHVHRARFLQPTLPRGR